MRAYPRKNGNVKIQSVGTLGTLGRGSDKCDGVFFTHHNTHQIIYNIYIHFKQVFKKKTG